MSTRSATGVWLGWLGAIVVLAGIGVAMRYTVLAPDPVEVEVYRVARGDVEETVTNSRAGTVRARRDARLSVEVAGRVVEIHKREDEPVEAGDPLVTLDETDAVSALTLADRRLDTAKAMVKEAEALHEDARLELERNRDLASTSQAILDRLQKKLDAVAAQVEAARARVAQEEAAYAMAESQRGKVVLRAPFAGVVAERHIELGEWAVPGKPVMRLMDQSHYVHAELDEVDLARVVKGLPARVLLDPHRGESFTGRVVRVASFVSDVEAQNRTVEIEVEFEGYHPPLKPGTSADVEVILQRAGGVLRIPTYALLEGNHVLVADGPRAKARTVEAGLRNWEFVEIRAGLTEGEPVIVTLDREEVRDGAAVRVRP